MLGREFKKRRKHRMNNNIEVIGIDHGWSQMKTSNTCFNTSIKELANAPAFHDNVLEYDDRYIAVGEERLEVLDSKVENENFYLLTLVAIQVFISSISPISMRRSQNRGLKKIMFQ